MMIRLIVYLNASGAVHFQLRRQPLPGLNRRREEERGGLSS